MQLIDHASITVRDLRWAKPFYKAVMAALGAIVAYEREDAIGFGERNRPHDDVHTYVSVFQSVQASRDPRRHWCFRAQSVQQVYAFHAAGLGAGGSDEGGQAYPPIIHNISRRSCAIPKATRSRPSFIMKRLTSRKIGSESAGKSHRGFPRRHPRSSPSSCAQGKRAARRDIREY